MTAKLYTLSDGENLHNSDEAFNIPYIPYLCLTGSNLLRFAVTFATIVGDTWRVGISADIDQSGCIAVGEVDTSDLTAIDGGGAFDVDVALALAIAVSARAVDFAVVFGIEIYDLEGRNGGLAWEV